MAEALKTCRHVEIDWSVMGSSSKIDREVCFAGPSAVQSI